MTALKKSVKPAHHGWYAMPRGWMDNDVFGDAPLTKREAWLWLIENAYYQPQRKKIKNMWVIIRRGQVPHSIRFLADKWRWSKSTVQRFINTLEQDGMIGTNRGTAHGTAQLIITICNYGVFSGDESIPEPGLGQKWDKDNKGKNNTYTSRVVAKTSPACAREDNVVNTKIDNLKLTKKEGDMTEEIRPGEIIQAFDEAIVAVYGDEHKRPWPAADDFVFAQRFLQAGATPDMCRALFTERMHKNKSAMKKPINGLRYFATAMPEFAERAKKILSEPLPTAAQSNILPMKNTQVCSCGQHTGMGSSSPYRLANSYAWHRKHDLNYDTEKRKFLESFEAAHGAVEWQAPDKFVDKIV
jgi:hypothetical protein